LVAHVGQKSVAARSGFIEYFGTAIAVPSNRRRTREVAHSLRQRLRDVIEQSCGLDAGRQNDRLSTLGPTTVADSRTRQVHKRIETPHIAQVSFVDVRAGRIPTNAGACGS
jgi:hypothetical protein